MSVERLLDDDVATVFRCKLQPSISFLVDTAISTGATMAHVRRLRTRRVVSNDKKDGEPRRDPSVAKPGRAYVPGHIDVPGEAQHIGTPRTRFTNRQKRAGPSPEIISAHPLPIHVNFGRSV